MGRKMDVKRILNCLPSQTTQLDWSIEVARAAGVIAEAAPIPVSSDLREPWWKIGNQGETGSCVGWATADSVLRWHFVKAGRLKKTELLSPRYIWMAAKETDKIRTRPTTFIERQGTTLKAALDIARKIGVVKESLLPFQPPHLYQGKEETFYAIAAQLKIASYYNIGIHPAKWKEWLANHGPVLIFIEVDETWHNAEWNPNGKLDAFKPDSGNGGHAAALVGYTSNRFIIRNSWGTRWGDKGFGYASASYAKKAIKEAYGVNI